ncbi:MAG: GntR family transcriptional regulator [Pseudomonadota bacterium]
MYRTLRARLLAGDLAPGVSLTIRGVAAETGVSMTPAREAVRRLAAERALSLTASGRILVPTPDAAALGELFEARALLEPALAARAVAALDRGGRAALGARLRACDDDLGRAVAAGDAPGYVRANTAFHAALYTAAGAPALLALVESVWLQTAPTMRCVYAVIGTRALEDHHAGALRGLAKGDAATVACAIRADVAQGATLVAELAEKSASAPG